MRLTPHAPAPLRPNPLADSDRTVASIKARANETMALLSDAGYRTTLLDDPHGAEEAVFQVHEKVEPGARFVALFGQPRPVAWLLVSRARGAVAPHWLLTALQREDGEALLELLKPLALRQGGAELVLHVDPTFDRFSGWGP